MEEKDLIEGYMREYNSSALYNSLISWAMGLPYARETLDMAFSLLDRAILEDFQSDFLITINKNQIFYRARCIDEYDYKKIDKGLCYDADRFYGYNYDESKEPPKEYASDGRANYRGESVLYLASEEITACVEVRPQIRQFVSVAKFKTISQLQILDFSKLKYSSPLDSNDVKYNVDMRQFLSSVLALFTRPVYGSDYIITQKIVEHFRKKGIKGIAYRSFYTNGTNYTFFDEYMNRFKWIDSRVVLNYAVANLFISLDKTKEMKDIDNRYMIEEAINKQLRDKLIVGTQDLFKCK